MIACKTLGKLLRIRGVVVDVGVLERNALEPKLKRQESAWGMDKIRRPEELIASRSVKLLLLSEIRAELFKRGMPIIGKRWELEARLEKLYAAEPPSGVPGGAAPVDKADADPTPESGPRETASEAAASMRLKYTDKIRARTGGRTGGGSVGSSSASASAQQAATDLRIATEIASASAEWRLRAGVRELVQYLDVRGMRRALLTDATATTEAAAAEQARELTSKLQVPNWDYVLPVADAIALRERGEGAALLAASEALGLRLDSILVLSTEPRVIGAARALHAPSCYFWREVPGVPKRIPADAVACSMNEVRHCVEDFNGVTFRDANTHIATRYGGG
jgi:hypothetical protein